MALEEHFRNGCGTPEVAVDLEDPGVTGGMRIEQVGAGGMLEQHGNRLPGFVAVEQAGPEVDSPGATPASIGASGSEPALQGNACGLREIGSPAQRDRTTRIERVHVRHVALPGFGLLEI